MFFTFMPRENVAHKNYCKVWGIDVLQFGEWRFVELLLLYAGIIASPWPTFVWTLLVVLLMPCLGQHFHCIVHSRRPNLASFMYHLHLRYLGCLHCALSYTIGASFLGPRSLSLVMSIGSQVCCAPWLLPFDNRGKLVSVFNVIFGPLIFFFLLALFLPMLDESFIAHTLQFLHVVVSGLLFYFLSLQWLSPLLMPLPHWSVCQHLIP